MAFRKPSNSSIYSRNSFRIVASSTLCVSRIPVHITSTPHTLMTSEIPDLFHGDHSCVTAIKDTERGRFVEELQTPILYNIRRAITSLLTYFFMKDATNPLLAKSILSTRRLRANSLVQKGSDPFERIGFAASSWKSLFSKFFSWWPRHLLLVLLGISKPSDHGWREANWRVIGALVGLGVGKSQHDRDGMGDPTQCLPSRSVQRLLEPLFGWYGQQDEKRHGLCYSRKLTKGHLSVATTSCISWTGEVANGGNGVGAWVAELNLIPLSLHYIAPRVSAR